MGIDGRLPMHYASDYGQLEVLQYLISKGANIDSADKHGISPLLAAIWEGHTSCVKFLVEKGASKSGTAPDGSSYVEAAEKEEIKAAEIDKIQNRQQCQMSASSDAFC